MTILIYLMAAASFVGIIIILWEHAQGYKWHAWPSVPGIIVQSKMVAPKGNKKEKTTFIYYKYTVNGKEHFSRRPAMYLTTLLSNGEASRLLEKYPENRDVTVWHHPFFHGFSVLETGPKQTALRMFLLGMFLLFFSICVMAILFPGYNLIFKFIMKATNDA